MTSSSSGGLEHPSSERDAPLSETSYGFAKRLEFVSAAVAAAAPGTVLDLGCGTGELLTVPLAARFPEIDFVGAEPDASSFQRALSRPLPGNMRFVTEATGLPAFDFVIASEVLEHTHDPEAFLLEVRDLLGWGGHLLLTVPNGFGPFELATVVLNLATIVGVYSFYARLKGPSLDTLADAPTASLADSPHVNFFRFRDLERLFAAAGFDVIQYKPRTLLCGFMLDRLVDGRLEQWNARVTDGLPSWAASGWMFDLKRRSGAAPRSGYARSALDRLRVEMHERARRGLGASLGAL